MVISKIIVKWFIGKELAMALGGTKLLLQGLDRLQPLTSRPI